VSDRVEIITAADFDERQLVAGIAGTYRGGRIISGDVVPAGDPLSAALLAILRQVEITAIPEVGPATICTDEAAILHCLYRDVEPMTREADELHDRLRRELGRLDGKVHLAESSPPGARRAHIAAKQVRKAWLAGAEGLRATWELAA
jgi:hypothetical protein